MNAFSKYFIDPIKNHYVDFEGRATRKQFWLFALWNFIVFLVIGFALDFFLEDVGNAIYMILQLAVLMPSLGMSVRRLHDIGRSGWWLLISFVPVVGFIVLLVFYCTPTRD